MRKPAVTQLASLLIAAAVVIFGSLPTANAANEGACPPDRPSGTPPNCCAEGLTFREGFCYPTNCPPGLVGTPPNCRSAGAGSDGQCPPGTIFAGGQGCIKPDCPGATSWDADKKQCLCPMDLMYDPATTQCVAKPKPVAKKCPAGMTGVPPNCECEEGYKLINGQCVRCPEGSKIRNGQCVCAGRTVEHEGRCAVLSCAWRGEAPFCDGACLRGEKHMGEGSSTESNSVGPTKEPFGKSCFSGRKVYCCQIK